MCVLNDRMLRQWAEFGGLTPFDPACVNPASVDLRWSGRWRYAKETNYATSADWSDERELDADKSLVIISGQLFLLDTIETVTIPNHLCGYLYLKSSIGRQGLEHLHAGFFDPGFSGTATLEIVNTAPWPVTITRSQRLVQLVLEQMAEPPLVPYTKTGRYNGQRGPQPAR